MTAAGILSVPPAQDNLLQKNLGFENKHFQTGSRVPTQVASRHPRAPVPAPPAFNARDQLFPFAV